MTEAGIPCHGQTVTVRIPISIRKRGGRKLVLAPDGTTETWAAPSRRVDNGQDNRPGVPLAGNAGDRHARDDR